MLPDLIIQEPFADPQTALFCPPAGVEMGNFLCHVLQNNEFFLNS